jgi:hypothetical protein
VPQVVPRAVLPRCLGPVPWQGSGGWSRRVLRAGSLHGTDRVSQELGVGGAAGASAGFDGGGVKGVYARYVPGRGVCGGHYGALYALDGPWWRRGRCRGRVAGGGLGRSAAGRGWWRRRCGTPGTPAVSAGVRPCHLDEPRPSVSPVSLLRTRRQETRGRRHGPRWVPAPLPESCQNRVRQDSGKGHAGPPGADRRRRHRAPGRRRDSGCPRSDGPRKGAPFPLLARRRRGGASCVCGRFRAGLLAAGILVWRPPSSRDGSVEVMSGGRDDRGSRRRATPRFPHGWQCSGRGPAVKRNVWFRASKIFNQTSD